MVRFNIIIGGSLDQQTTLLVVAIHVVVLVMLPTEHGLDLLVGLPSGLLHEHDDHQQSRETDAAENEEAV